LIFFFLEQYRTSLVFVSEKKGQESEFIKDERIRSRDCFDAFLLYVAMHAPRIQGLHARFDPTLQRMGLQKCHKKFILAVAGR
jgi:hypothetical protein